MWPREAQPSSKNPPQPRQNAVDVIKPFHRSKLYRPLLSQSAPARVRQAGAWDLVAQGLHTPGRRGHWAGHRARCDCPIGVHHGDSEQKGRGLPGPRTRRFTPVRQRTKRSVSSGRSWSAWRSLRGLGICCVRPSKLRLPLAFDASCGQQCSSGRWTVTRDRRPVRASGERAGRRHRGDGT